MRISDIQMLLKVKTHLEKKAQQELAQIQQKKERENEVLGSLKETKETAMTEAVQHRKTRATEMQTSSAFINSLSHQIQQQAKKIDEIVTQEDGKRVELQEKSKSKKMMEKLGEKRQAEETKQADMKEQGMMDMLAQRLQPEE